jgi:hypothetical protein
MKNLTNNKRQGRPLHQLQGNRARIWVFGAASFNVSSLLRILVEVEFAVR